MKFTKASVERFQPPAKTDHFEWDDATPGFGIRYRGGRRVWVAQIRSNGQTRRLAIGNVAQIALEPAREAARRFFALAALGRDPVAERAAARARAANTVGVAIEKYLAAREPVVRPNTFRHLDRYLRQYFVTLHRHAIDSVTRRDVATAVADVAAAHGPVSAARARSALSAFYAWALREGLAGESSPVEHTNSPSNEKPRDRTLSPAEIRSIWSSLPPGEFGSIVRLLFLTGCRRQEIGSLERSEVDLDRALLVIPAAKTKSHRELRLPLVDEAVAILRSAAPRTGSNFIFGGERHGFTSFSYTHGELRKALAAVGDVVESWNLHDIRRTVRSELGELGVEPWIAETILGHARAGIEGVYNKAKLERQMRQALEMWAERLREIVEGVETNVIALHA